MGDRSEGILEDQPGARRRFLRPALAGLVASILLLVVLFWFQPQKLLIDRRVSEPPPVSESAASPSPEGGGSPSTSGPEPSPPSPLEVARGSFVALDHATAGVVRVLEADDGRVLRLEDFETDNGPDLFLYLTAEPVGGEEGAFDDQFVNLGRLKGNQGNQNYDVPDGVDLMRFRTVVIWCDRFNSAFGGADLSHA